MEDTTMMVMLTNNFHGTRHAVRMADCPKPHDDEAVAIVEVRLTTSQARRARAALCGIKTCTCSGPTGTRGSRVRATVIQG
jgi:hypothetical protein